MKTLWTALLIIAFGLSYAQEMEDETKVLDDKQGEALFTLNPGVRVFSFDSNDGWYKIRLEVWVESSESVDDNTIIAGVVLKDKEGKELGKTKVDVEVAEGKVIQLSRKKSKFRAIIEGYVFKTKFADDSRPEQRIEDLLALKNRTEQLEGLQELFRDYGFEERKFEDLTAFALREEGKTLADEKDFRVIVVLRGGTTIYAVLTNNQSVTAPKIKLTWEDDPYKAIYLYKPTGGQSEIIQDDILYSFLAL